MASLCPSSERYLSSGTSVKSSLFSSSFFVPGKNLLFFFFFFTWVKSSLSSSSFFYLGKIPHFDDEDASYVDQGNTAQHPKFCNLIFILITVIMRLISSGKYSHPNIVRLVDICHGERNPGDREMVLYLVFEHMDQV